MLKEVGASGQISLGKKFAGQLFDVQFLDTGAVQMLPVRVVPAVLEQPNTTIRSKPQKLIVDGNPQEQWQSRNAEAIHAFNQRIEELGSPAQRLHAWRNEPPKLALASSAAFHLQFGAWINEMNQLVDQHGVWSDGLMEAEQPHGAV
jgi:Post-segregation antitoxin CcdA